MAQEPTGHELLRFAITFIMSWKIWTKVTFTLGWFESNDVLTKLKVLFNLACLVGFTTNLILVASTKTPHTTHNVQLVAPLPWHCVERTNAFVSLVLGYSVVGILFQSNGGYNLDAFLGKAILGLLQAFFVNWIYFDIDANPIGLHAISSVSSSKFQWVSGPMLSPSLLLPRCLG
ncbi:hypothetical protein ACQRIT_004636 [Beauveria bassiana]